MRVLQSLTSRHVDKLQARLADGAVAIRALSQREGDEAVRARRRVVHQRGAGVARREGRKDGKGVVARPERHLGLPKKFGRFELHIGEGRHLAKEHVEIHAIRELHTRRCEHERAPSCPQLLHTVEDRKDGAWEKTILWNSLGAKLASACPLHEPGWPKCCMRLAAARLAVCQHIDVDAI